MTKTAQLKLIARAYDALPAMSHGFTDEREILFAINAAGERRHRRGAPAGIKHGLTVKQAAQLFTVKFIADALLNPDRFNVTDVLDIRPECIRAYALAVRYRAKIIDAWDAARIDQDAVRALDYAALQRS